MLTLKKNIKKILRKDLFAVACLLLFSFFSQTTIYATSTVSGKEPADWIPPKGPDEISVALIGPIDDETMKKIEIYFNKLNVDYILRVKDADEVLIQIAKLSKATNKKIKFLIIGGHGDPTPKEQGFRIGSTAFVMNRIDFVSLEKELIGLITQKREFQQKLCELNSKIQNIDLPKGEKIILESEIENLKKRLLLINKGGELPRSGKFELGIDQYHFLLSNIDRAYGVMSQGGVIVLMNCFSGMKEHLPFARIFGQVLFGDKAGKIIVSEEEIVISGATWPIDSSEESLLLDGLRTFVDGFLRWFAWGFSLGDINLNPFDVDLKFSHMLLKTEPLPYNPIPNVVPVSIVPQCEVADAMTDMRIGCDVKEWENSGTIAYVWDQECAQHGEKTCLLTLDAAPGSVKQVKVAVRDQVGRTGEDIAYIIIRKLGIILEVSEDKAIKGATISARAQVKEGGSPDDIWKWSVSGGITLTSLSTGPEATFKVNDPSTITVRLFRYGPFGMLHFLGEESHPIKIKEEVEREEKPDDKKEDDKKQKAEGERIGREKAEKEKAEKEKAEKEKKDKDEAKKEDVKKPRPPGAADLKSVTCANPTGVFDKEPFNGLQVRYGISGICVGPAKDSAGFTLSRRFDILGVTGDTITVSGSSVATEAVCYSWAGSFWSQTDVSLSVGGQTKTWSSPKPCERVSKEKYNVSQPASSFSVSLPVPRDKPQVDVSVSIRHDNGDRGVVVSGSGRQIQEVAGAFPEGGQDGIPPSAPLKASVDGPRVPIPIGQEVNLNAQVEGGTSPYGLQWSGAVSGRGERIRFKPSGSGEHVVNLAVTDSKGQAASAALTVKVEPLKLELDGVPAQPLYGSQAKLAAQIVGPAPQGVKCRYLWQASEPGIEFDPVESVNGETKVTFGRMGAIRLWAQVVDGHDGRTVGETEQKGAKVVAPKLTVTFTPSDKQGRVGQEIRAKIAAQPEIPAELIDYRWLEPASSNRMEYANNAAEIGFKVKDSKPLALNALARVPYYGDEIADITSSYTGISYDVKIGEPRATGPGLQVWQCDTQFGGAVKCGMKDIPPGQFATFQDITLRAEVTPAPESPRYRWTVNPTGSCGLPGIGNELKLNCSSTGGYTVKLEVLAADGILLGQAERSVSISVRDEQIKQSPRSQQAYEKTQEARQRVAQGKLDEAISLAGEAAKLDPKNMEASTLLNKWRTEKQTIQSELDKVNSLIPQNKFNEAEKELSFAKNLHPKYQPVINAEALLREKKELSQKSIVEKLGRAKGFLAQQKISEATKLTEEVLGMDPANNEAKNLLQQLREAKIRDDKAQGLINDAWNLEKNKRYEEALKKYKEAHALIPNAEVQERIVNLESLEKQANRLLNEGFSLEKQGNINEALKRYKEAQGIYPYDGVARKIAELEHKDRQATQLLQAGYQAEKSGRLAEAVAKYRQGYQIVPNQQIANKIAELEKAIDEQNKKQQWATQLRNQGAAFQQRGMYREALEKYRESLTYWPDPGLVDHIAKVEAEIKRQEAQVKTQPPLTSIPPAATGRDLLPRPAGLVSWWPGDGNPNDIVGTRHGTLRNGAAFAPGIFGQAFKLDGVDGFVDLGAWNLGALWTIEAWVNPSSTPTGRKTIAGGMCECRDWSITMENGELGMVIRPPGGCSQTIGSGVLALPGTWYHIAGVSDGVTGRVYINGEPKKSGTQEANYTGTSQGTRIGGSFWSAGYNFPGLIDEVRFYNRALSAQEIATSYNAGRTAMSGTIAQEGRPPIEAAGTPGAEQKGAVVPLGRTVLLRSLNNPNLYLRHRNFLLDLTAVASTSDRSDASFRIVPGLADNRLISFESVNYPGHYLRHMGGRLKLHKQTDEQLFRDDATYKVVPGLADPSWVSFESKNYPGWYIRHRNAEGWIERIGADPSRKDSTFRFEN